MAKLIPVALLVFLFGTSAYPDESPPRGVRVHLLRKRGQIETLSWPARLDFGWTHETTPSIGPMETPHLSMIFEVPSPASIAPEVGKEVQFPALSGAPSASGRSYRVERRGQAFAYPLLLRRSTEPPAEKAVLALVSEEDRTAYFTHPSCLSKNVVLGRTDAPRLAVKYIAAYCRDAAPEPGAAMTDAIEIFLFSSPELKLVSRDPTPGWNQTEKWTRFLLKRRPQGDFRLPDLTLVDREDSTQSPLPLSYLAGPKGVATFWPENPTPVALNLVYVDARGDVTAALRSWHTVWHWEEGGDGPFLELLIDLPTRQFATRLSATSGVFSLKTPTPEGGHGEGAIQYEPRDFAGETYYWAHPSCSGAGVRFPLPRTGGPFFLTARCENLGSSMRIRVFHSVDARLDFSGIAGSRSEGAGWSEVELKKPAGPRETVLGSFKVFSKDGQRSEQEIIFEPRSEKRLSWSLGTGLSFYSYREPVTDTTLAQGAWELSGSIRFDVVPEKLDVSLGGAATLLPFATSPAGSTSARFYDLHAELAYRAGLSRGLELRGSLGWNSWGMITSGAYGVSYAGGPLIGVGVGSPTGVRTAWSGYLKFSPLVGDLTRFSFSNRKWLVGGAYQVATLSVASSAAIVPISVTLDLTSAAADGTQGTELNHLTLFSGALGLALGF